MKFKQKSKRKEVGYQIYNEFDKIGKAFGGGGEWVLGCKMMMGRSLFLFLISNWPRRAYVHGRLRVGHVRSRRVMGSVNGY